jgi:phage/plasmid-like protein (TIGR03299 family)
MTTTTTDATARKMPWDVMGEKLKAADRTNVAKTLKAAGLDYAVEVWDARAAQPETRHNTELTTPEFQALVRPMPDGSKRVLGYTKKRYTPIQNVDAFNVADILVREFGAQIIGAADYRGGDRSLIAVDLAEPVALVRPDGGEDRVDLDLIITNDHAGNASLTMALTPIRVACTNALPAAMRGAERVWKISHTPNAQKRIHLAEEAIVKAVTYADAFQAQAQAMMDQTMVDAEFQKMVAKLYPVKEGGQGAAAERRREVQAQLLTAWHSSPTIEGIQGTRWAGYNVVTEYLDHFRPVRGEEAVSRAEGALDGPYVRQKAKLWQVFAA